jgi:hypothetical protein
MRIHLVPLIPILSASLLTLCPAIAFVVDILEGPARDVSLGDLDGDGDLDAFFANGRYEAFKPNTVWTNDGTGRFSDSGQQLGKPMDTHSAALGDLDADGDLDAWVGNGINCQMFENDGKGGFTAHLCSSTPGDSGAWRWTVALDDLDGDGDLDAFAAGCCGGTTGSSVSQPYNMVWLNDGTGSFQDSGQRLGILGSKAIALGDLDGDRDIDAFVGNSDSMIDVHGGDWHNQPNRVWLNDGRGRFRDSGQSLGSAETQALALGDVESDGDLDVFVGNDGPNEVWLNDGRGNFSNSGQVLGDAYTRVVALADLDNDGDLDAFVGNVTSSEVWLNDGAGNFGPSGQGMRYSGRHVVALGDVDGNGTPDVFAGSYDRNCRVWYNDGTGHFRRGERTVFYWLAGGVVVIVAAGLGMLCWWVIRCKQRS